MGRVYYAYRDWLDLRPMDSASEGHPGMRLALHGDRWWELDAAGRETGRSWPVGDVRGTGAAVIDGVSYLVWDRLTVERLCSQPVAA